MLSLFCPNHSSNSEPHQPLTHPKDNASQQDTELTHSLLTVNSASRQHHIVPLSPEVTPLPTGDDDVKQQPKDIPTLQSRASHSEPSSHQTRFTDMEIMLAQPGYCCWVACCCRQCSEQEQVRFYAFSKASGALFVGCVLFPLALELALFAQVSLDDTTHNWLLALATLGGGMLSLMLVYKDLTKANVGKNLFLSLGPTFTSLITTLLLERTKNPATDHTTFNHRDYLIEYAFIFLGCLAIAAARTWCCDKNERLDIISQRGKDNAQAIKALEAAKEQSPTKQVVHSRSPLALQPASPSYGTHQPVNNFPFPDSNEETKIMLGSISANTGYPNSNGTVYAKGGVHGVQQRQQTDKPSNKMQRAQLDRVEMNTSTSKSMTLLDQIIAIIRHLFPKKNYPGHIPAIKGQHPAIEMSPKIQSKLQKENEYSENEAAWADHSLANVANQAIQQHQVSFEEFVFNQYTFIQQAILDKQIQLQQLKNEEQQLKNEELDKLLKLKEIELKLAQLNTNNKGATDNSSISQFQSPTQNNNSNTLQDNV